MKLINYLISATITISIGYIIGYQYAAFTHTEKPVTNQTVTVAKLNITSPNKE